MIWSDTEGYCVIRNSGNNKYPPDLDEQKMRYSSMMQLLAMSLAVCMVIVTAVLFVIDGGFEMISFVIFTLVIYFCLFFVFRKGNLRSGFYAMLYLNGLFVMIGNTMVGWKSGICILLFLMIPMIFFNPIIQKIEKITIGLVISLMVVVAIVFNFLFVPIVLFDSFQLQAMNGSIIFSTFMILACIIYMDYVSEKRISKRLLDLNQQLSEQASRDSLTNLLNRRTMSQMIQMEHNRFSRSGKTFGLIMADVDDFKQVNDRFGHAAGDLVLTELSSMLSAILRKQDLTARWGGEEFLILLPDTDFEGVQSAAEKIRDMVSHSGFMYQGTPIRVTLSIGGVVCQPQENWDDCLKHADRALYYGKNHGKNMAIFSQGEQYCILGDLAETQLGMK